MGPEGLSGVYAAQIVATREELIELRMPAVHPRLWSKVSIGIIVDSPSCRKERR